MGDALRGGPDEPGYYSSGRQTDFRAGGQRRNIIRYTIRQGCSGCCVEVGYLCECARMEARRQMMRFV